MKFSFHVSPNYRDSKSTSEIMMDVTLCLLAVLTFSAVWYGVSFGAAYGFRVVLLAVCAVVSALATEAVYFRLCGKDIIHGLTHSYAWVTALIIVLISKIDTSYYAMIVATALALIFGKLVFGGFGQNIFNPAALGAAIIMNSFSASTAADFTTSATPLAPMQSAGWVMDSTQLGQYLSQFGGLGNMFIGNYPSVIGGSCALLIILCYAFLTWRHDLNWRTPLVYIGTIAVISLAAGIATGQGIEFMVLNLLAGGVMLCGVFMLTDPVTSPVTISGRYMFAVGAAVLTLLIRWKANLPDGALYSILLMNMLTPAIDLACDGSMIKDGKKIQMRTIAVCALTAVVGLAVGVTLKPAAAAETPAPSADATTEGGADGTTEAMQEGGSADLSQYEAVAEEISNDGTTAVYQCSAKGFGLISGHAGDYSENEAEVTVSLSDLSVVSVKITNFGDTKGVGDQATTDEALAAYEGVTSAAEVDAVSSATYTSESVQAMVQAALDAAAGNSSAAEEPSSADYSEYAAAAEEISNDGTTAVYQCSAKGFGLISGHAGDYSENEAEVTVSLSDLSVVSVKITNFGDTKGVGDQATTDEALAAYEGVVSADEADTVTNATYTSESVQAMVQAALDLAAGK